MISEEKAAIVIFQEPKGQNLLSESTVLQCILQSPSQRISVLRVLGHRLVWQEQANGEAA
jgi:hypothetical protein